MKPWAKVPRFSERPWERCSPRTSKTVRGTRAERRVPRTVFEVRGLALPQRSRGETWNLFIIPWFCWFTPVRKTWNIGSTVFQCPMFFANWGTLKNSTSNVPCFMNNPGKCPVLLLGVKSAKPGFDRECPVQGPQKLSEQLK